MISSSPMRIFAPLVIFICLLTTSCAFNNSSLRTQLANKPVLTGNYNLILYGAHFYNDIATVALIIPEGSNYNFDIFSPDYNYRTLKGVAAAEAFEIARKFVRWHPDSTGSQTSEILDDKGHAIAYEVRPLYNPVSFGVSDVMNVDYFLEANNKISVHIDLLDQAKRIFMGDDQGKIH